VTTKEQSPTRYEEDVIDFGEYFAILRKNGWKIALFSLAVGLVTLLVMFQFPDIYQATPSSPPVDEKRPNPALGILASLGIDVGSPTRWKTWKPFSEPRPHRGVFRKYNLWPIVLRTSSIPRPER